MTLLVEINLLLFVVCCNRKSRGCATHALVENILSVIASIVLIYFDAKFLQNPSTCYWPYDLCLDDYWDLNSGIWWNIYDFDGPKAKIIAVKVQLSCAAIMLALCLLFIVVYIYTSLKVKAGPTSIDPRNTIELRPQQRPPPPQIPVWVEPPVWSPSSNY